MLCVIHIDKKSGRNLQMARIGEDAYLNVLKKRESLPKNFTGRPMKGYIFVNPEDFDTGQDLSYWITLCLAFNPTAKASASKKKKTSFFVNNLYFKNLAMCHNLIFKS